MRGLVPTPLPVPNVHPNRRAPTPASGSLTYQTEIRMGSEVMGRVQSLHVEEGDSVKQGDILLRLDPATVQTQPEIL